MQNGFASEAWLFGSNMGLGTAFALIVTTLLVMIERKGLSEHPRAVRWFIGLHGFMLVGFLSYILRLLGYLPLNVSAAINFVMLLIAYLCLHQALLYQYNYPLSRRFQAAIALVVVAGPTYMLLVVEAGQSYAYRVVLNTTIIASIQCHAVWVIWRRRDPANLGQTVQFVALAASTLLGPVLMCLFALNAEGRGTWVRVGFIWMWVVSLMLIDAAMLFRIMYDALQRHWRDSVVDALTGLFNRRHFMAAAPTLAALGARAGRPVGLIMCDLDHFKRVNDTFGHAVGDQVLRAFADTLKNVTRRQDLSARFGGEEFVILLPDTGADETARLAERVRAAVADLNRARDNLPPISASFGCSQLNGDGDLEAALARADTALYLAKENGRNRVETASASDAAVTPPAMVIAT